ncbi:MAG: hypothetical protein WBC44_12035 [Planctomycetaceae bacterium]
MAKDTQHRWWQKKRWQAVGLLWMLAIYESSFGPGIYAVERGWISARLLWTIHPEVIPDEWYVATGAARYNQWWQNLGRRHAGKPPKVYP